MGGSQPATLTVQAATRKPPPACFHVEQRLCVETIASPGDHPNLFADQRQGATRISLPLLLYLRGNDIIRLHAIASHFVAYCVRGA